MVKNNEVIKEFINTNNEDLRTQNIFIMNRAIFSYGFHFPMGIKVFDSDGKVIFILNKNKYSMTTSRHQNTLKREIGNNFKVYFMNTNRLKDLFNKKITNFNDLIIEDLEKD